MVVTRNAGERCEGWSVTYLDILKKAELDLGNEPKEAPSVALRDELNEKSSLPTESVSGECPSKECFACRGWLFWRSVHGAVVCAACHPPASRELVREWIWTDRPKQKMWKWII